MSAERIPAIKIREVAVTLGGVEILSRVFTTIYKNEITALIGPNGAGKTTLLLALLGLVPFQGNISFDSSFAQPLRIGYVPQHIDLDRGLPLTVMDYLSLKMQRRPLWLGYAARVKQQILTALQKVEAAHIKDRQLGKLSGGELHRVSLAMALMGDPEILFLDEPVAGVDVKGEEMFATLLSNLQKNEQLTLVLVSHDLSLVTKYADQVICLNHCVHCQGRSAEVLTPETIAKVYGAHMGVYDHDVCQVIDDEDETGA